MRIANLFPLPKELSGQNRVYNPRLCGESYRLRFLRPGASFRSLQIVETTCPDSRGAER